MLRMLFLARVENMTNGQTHTGRWVEYCDERTNGQTHIGRWVKNVTNRRTDEHTQYKNGDGLTDGSTESCFLR